MNETNTNRNDSNDTGQKCNTCGVDLRTSDNAVYVYNTNGDNTNGGPDRFCSEECHSQHLDTEEITEWKSW